MTRVRLPLGRTVFVLIAFLIALILFLPLRLGLDWLRLDEAGLSAREARGSVWAGRMTEARFGAASVGDVRTGLSPLRLLVGRARVDVARDAGDDVFEGALQVSRNMQGIDDVTATLPLGTSFAPLPIAAIGLSEVSVRFVAGVCDRAEGAARLILSGDIAGISLAQGLTAAARCDGGALLLPFASQSGQERLDLRIAASGAWSADLTVAATDPALVGRLSTAGFSPGPGGYTMSLTGD